MGGFLTVDDHAIALKAHPKRDVIVVGDAGILEDEGLRIGPVSPQPLGGSVLPFGHAVDAIQTDWPALGLGPVGKGQVPPVAVAESLNSKRTAFIPTGFELKTKVLPETTPAALGRGATH